MRRADTRAGIRAGATCRADHTHTRRLDHNLNSDGVPMPNTTMMIADGNSINATMVRGNPPRTVTNNMFTALTKHPYTRWMMHPHSTTSVAGTRQLIQPHIPRGTHTIAGGYTPSTATRTRRTNEEISRAPPITPHPRNTATCVTARRANTRRRAHRHTGCARTKAHPGMTSQSGDGCIGLSGDVSHHYNVNNTERAK